MLASSTQAAAFCNDLASATNAAACWQNGQLTVVPYGDAAVTAGQVSSSVESYQVPTGPTYPGNSNTRLEYPQIVVSFSGSFAGDGGVTYQSGEALNRVTAYAPTGVAGSGSPGQGQYYVSGGVYYFNPADINQGVIITYDWAATGSYVPNTTPIYDFTIDDCLPNQVSVGKGVSDPSSPVVVVRKPRDQMLNNIKVEYLDRNNNYNPVNIERKDEASIIAFGRERPSEVNQYHFFCLAGAAQQSATLQLIRQQVARTFQWTVGRHFAMILELMAIATITDPGQGLLRQPVRIIEIQENADFSLTITAEEFLGTVSAPLYGAQATAGYVIDYNVDPGAINRPIIFEPTDELNQTNSVGPLQIWVGVSGTNTAVWGGCFVWVSADGETYSKAGEILGPARMGALNSLLPAVTPSPTGAQTIDAVNTLSVDLSESAGVLASGTVLDATSLNTRCYVGGEIVGYETATLDATNRYTLSYLVRGAFGTEAAIATHPAGTAFLRLDDGVFAFAFDQSRIGRTIYIKFQSFNIFQGGLQNLAEVAVYPYQITGAALASPLPSVQNLRTVFDVNSGFVDLDWDGISDFRPFKYEIRSGSSFASAATLGQVAHPPFRVPGNGHLLGRGGGDSGIRTDGLFGDLAGRRGIGRGDHAERGAYHRFAGGGLARRVLRRRRCRHQHQCHPHRRRQYSFRRLDFDDARHAQLRRRLDGSVSADRHLSRSRLHYDGFGRDHLPADRRAGGAERPRGRQHSRHARYSRLGFHRLHRRLSVDQHGDGCRRRSLLARRSLSVSRPLCSLGTGLGGIPEVLAGNVSGALSEFRDGAQYRRSADDCL